MASTVTLVARNQPYGIDETQSRMILRGKAVFGSGTYAALGPTPSYSPIYDESGAAVTLPTLVGVNPKQFQVTGVSVTSNVVTLTAQNTLSAGQSVSFSGFGTATALNGQTLVVQSATATQFTVNLTTSNVSLPTEQGVAVLVQGPDEMFLYSDSGSGYVYNYIPRTGQIAILQSAGSAAPLAQLATNAAIPSGVLTDVVHFQASWAKQ